MAFKRSLIQQQNVCSECGAVLDSNQLKTHFHAVQKLDSGDYLLVLSETITPGTWDAAQALGKAKKELEEKAPGLVFQFVPFGFTNNSQSGYESNLHAILALVNSKNEPKGGKT